MSAFFSLTQSFAGSEDVGPCIPSVPSYLPQRGTLSPAFSLPFLSTNSIFPPSFPARHLPCCCISLMLLAWNTRDLHFIMILLNKCLLSGAVWVHGCHFVNAEKAQGQLCHVGQNESSQMGRSCLAFGMFLWKVCKSLWGKKKSLKHWGECHQVTISLC